MENPPPSDVAVPAPPPTDPTPAVIDASPAPVTTEPTPPVVEPVSVPSGGEDHLPVDQSPSDHNTPFLREVLAQLQSSFARIADVQDVVNTLALQMSLAAANQVTFPLLKHTITKPDGEPVEETYQMNVDEISVAFQVAKQNLEELRHDLEKPLDNVAFKLGERKEPHQEVSGGVEGGSPSPLGESPIGRIRAGECTHPYVVARRQLEQNLERLTTAYDQARAELGGLKAEMRRATINAGIAQNKIALLEEQSLLDQKALREAQEELAETQRRLAVAAQGLRLEEAPASSPGAAGRQETPRGRGRVRTAPTILTPEQFALQEARYQQDLDDINYRILQAQAELKAAQLEKEDLKKQLAHKDRASEAAHQKEKDELQEQIRELQRAHQEEVAALKAEWRNDEKNLRAELRVAKAEVTRMEGRAARGKYLGHPQWRSMSLSGPAAELSCVGLIMQAGVLGADPPPGKSFIILHPYVVLTGRSPITLVTPATTARRLATPRTPSAAAVPARSPPAAAAAASTPRH
ncbi:hypothetical protein PAPYR_10927 [Paratrimastix pyriformis]|uniref:Uncharacterized protein n=1 Tax=Paratrimastix pyriformis TaxID=342808 RepID=A0ABQ8UAN0_9EUKA|nr:hypothetical protein PAPYR_10927 [Paratrimastix pyriformis]